MRRGRRCCDQPSMCCPFSLRSVRNAVWKVASLLGTLSLSRRKHAPQSWVGGDKERARSSFVISADAEQIGRRADGEGGAGWAVRQTSSFVINVHSEGVDPARRWNRGERALMHVWRLSTRGHCRRQGASVDKRSEAHLSSAWMRSGFEVEETAESGAEGWWRQQTSIELIHRQGGRRGG
ncbi:hypothetical protein BDZ97DRAFT_1833388 [Flammula alnicola]|nr:hypothetical protein BDZ97DRAFT_1833388 [Flammula alnicola]